MLTDDVGPRASETAPGRVLPVRAVVVCRKIMDNNLQLSYIILKIVRQATLRLDAMPGSQYNKLGIK